MNHKAFTGFKYPPPTPLLCYNLFWAKPQLVESISIVNITTAWQFNIQPLIWISTGSRYSKLINDQLSPTAGKSHSSTFLSLILNGCNKSQVKWPSHSKFHTSTRLTLTGILILRRTLTSTPLIQPNFTTPLDSDASLAAASSAGVSSSPLANPSSNGSCDHTHIQPLMHLIWRLFYGITCTD